MTAGRQNDDGEGAVVQGRGEEGVHGKREALAARREAVGLTQEALADRIGVDSSTVGRWERGVLTPSPVHRGKLASALDLSFVELDALLKSRPPAQGSIVSTAAQHVPAITALQPGAVMSAAGHGLVGQQGGGAASSTLVSARGSVAKLHETYQAARYVRVSGGLEAVADFVDALAESGPSQERREAQALQCSIAILKAKLATVENDGRTAWSAAERCRAVAEEIGDQFWRAAAAYQAACALLKLDRAAEAEQLAVDAASSMRGDGPRRTSWKGSLLLIAAVVAARRGDGALGHQRLHEAYRLAQESGKETNVDYTAFGPANVAIHRMSVAMALDDPYQLLSAAEQVDITRLPAGLRGRKARFHLASAWAHTRIHEDAFAVLHLLEADRAAPENVRLSATAHEVVRELMSRERRLAVPGLRELALRTGIEW